MGAKENVATIRRAKTITATIILRENGWLKAISGSKRDDIGYQQDKDNYVRYQHDKDNYVGYQHDKDNYIRMDQHNYLCSLPNILKGGQAM